MKAKCKSCGAPCEGEGYCFRHKPRKPLPKSRIPVKKQANDRKSSDLHEFFLKLWKKFPHYSMVSGKYLGNEPLSVFFHHILPKEKYPEASLDEENIILLTLEEHDQVEMDIYRYEEVNIRRNLLKAKYERAK
jgi:hypothetical protein